MVALIADLGQISSQRGESPVIASMLATALRCLTLDSRLRRTLAATHRAVRRDPESALDVLVELRSAVLVPVPGLLAEVYLGPRRAAVRSRRRSPPSATPLCFSAAASAGK